MSRGTALICFAAVSVTACGGSDENARMGADAGGDAAAALGDVKLTWSVHEHTFTLDAPPIAGAKVCVLDHTDIPCVVTDAQGAFTISGLPRDSIVDLTFEEDSHMKAMRTILTASTDMVGPTLGFIRMFGANPDPASWGIPVDLTKGILGFAAVGAVGSTASLSPDMGVQPLYSASTGYDPSLNSIVVGGVFPNLPDGSYTVTITAPSGLDCEGITSPFSGWGVPLPQGQHGTTMHVRGGYFSSGAWTTCTAVAGSPDAGDGG